MGGQIPSRHMTSFLINQCQIITFLILKSDNIENSRIELKGIILQVRSIQIKLHLLLFYPSTWYICDIFLFHIEIEGKCGWIIGGGQRVCWPPSQIPAPPPPPPPPLPPFLRLCVVPSAHIRIAYDFCHHSYIHSKELKWLHQKLEFKVFKIDSQR